MKLKYLYTFVLLLISYQLLPVNYTGYESNANRADHSPLVVFEKNSLSISEESKTNIEKTFLYLKDSLPDFFDKYYIMLHPYSCADELKVDKYIGIKRCLILFEFINSLNNTEKKVKIYINPANYDKEPSNLMYCIKSGVYVVLLGGDPPTSGE
jgi:hypothetical protein